MWVLVTGVFAVAEVHAQARSPVSRTSKAQVQKTGGTDTAARSKKRQQLEAWLRRLVGSFELKGTVLQYLNSVGLTSRGIDGDMTCTGVGDGPGVHCLVKATFRNTTWSLGGGGGGTATPLVTFNTLNPAVMLFALDPDDLNIKVLLVDDHSIADDLSGLLIGDQVELASGRKGCWGPMNLPHCPWALRITAKPDSDVIRVETTWKSGGIQIEFLLRRESGSPANVEMGTPE